MEHLLVDLHISRYKTYLFAALQIILCAGTFNTSLASQHRRRPALIQADTSLDSASCQRTASVGVGLAQHHQSIDANDTLRRFIETCATAPYAYRMFTYLTGAVSEMSGLWDKWSGYRNWLFKVLYYNPDSMYYCSDATSMLSTFAVPDPIRGDDWNGKLSVMQFILQSGKCPLFVNSLHTSWEAIRKEEYEGWQDTVKDSLLTPFDTTLPTLEQIGFQILRGPEYAAVSPEQIATHFIESVSVTPDPVTAKSEVVYALNYPTILTIELYDPLGRRIKTLLNAQSPLGEHRLALPEEDLISGTYYVRVSSSRGEVKTVKILKQ